MESPIAGQLTGTLTWEGPATVLAPTHIVLAAANSPYRDHCEAQYQCDGVDDQAQLNLAVQSIEIGGTIELLAGTYTFGARATVSKDSIVVEGHGEATCIVPSPTFPAEDYLLEVYADDVRPVYHAQVRQLALKGEGVEHDYPVHGLRWCGARGRLTDLWIMRLSGDGLWVHNARDWNGMETIFDRLNLGYNGGVGVRANSTDAHWDKCVIHNNAEGNLVGVLTGTMVTACHFYGGADNPKGQQTQVNIELRQSSRVNFNGGKIEHAARELVKLIGDPKGGSIRFCDIGFRNGCSEDIDPADEETVSAYSQVRIDKTGGNFWVASWTGCRFDADANASRPRYNIEIVGDSLRNGRITGCEFSGAGLEAVTPFGPGVGLRSTLNGYGWTDQDPNYGGPWFAYGEVGLCVIEAGTRRVWRAVNAAEWE